MPSVPFKKILIANRGEIAVRVICACKELGISDRRRLLRGGPLQLRTCASPTRPSASDRPRARAATWIFRRIISAAEITNVDAIHPGYGFLSENAEFAEVCEASRHQVHRAQAGRDPADGREGTRARLHARDWACRCCPAPPGVLDSPEEALELAAQIGYPVILKASAGGGGRGMRIVHSSRGSARRCSLQAQNGGGRGLQFARRLPGKVHRRAAAHRIPGAGRRARQRGDPGRARVQHPAAPSEAAGGIALAGGDRRAARRDLGSPAQGASRTPGTPTPARWSS